MYKIFKCRSAAHLEEVRRLHERILPSDSWESVADHQHWLVLCSETGKYVGFASFNVLKNEPGGFLSRSGVLAAHSGNGLQRRLIRVRINAARRMGLKFLVTYTLKSNVRSFTNLILSRFRFYTPARKWAGDVFYFYRRL